MSLTAPITGYARSILGGNKLMDVQEIKEEIKNIIIRKMKNPSAT